MTPAVLFDWDGTLLDSAEASYRCYERLFGAFGIAFDRAGYERTYSPDWYRTYAGVGLATERWDEADTMWLRLYGGEEPALLPDARDVLDRLRAAGLSLGVVTSGSRRRIERDLTRLSLDSFFDAVVCSEDAARRKPHPEPLLLGLDRIGASPERAACVGDSPEDIEMSRAAGVFSVGITGAFPNRDALLASRPDLVAASLKEAADRLLARLASG